LGIVCHDNEGVKQVSNKNVREKLLTTQRISLPQKL